MPQLANLLGFFLRFLFILPAIILHEIAHGYVAYLLGDPTAKNAGRLSLNPIRHIDLFGTILLPALLILSNIPGFGYAKPVPINPRYFKDYRRGFFLTGLAGPATNLVLAVVSGLLVRFFAVPLAATGAAGTIAANVVYYFAEINLVLLFFNLIPIPPFDGSRVLPLFLSDAAMRTYARVERYGFVILLGLLWIVPQVFRVDPIGAYFSVTVDPLLRLIVG